MNRLLQLAASALMCASPMLQNWFLTCKAELASWAGMCCSHLVAVILAGWLQSSRRVLHTLIANNLIREVNALGRDVIFRYCTVSITFSANILFTSAAWRHQQLLAHRDSTTGHHAHMSATKHLLLDSEFGFCASSMPQSKCIAKQYTP